MPRLLPVVQTTTIALLVALSPRAYGASPPLDAGERPTVFLAAGLGLLGMTGWASEYTPEPSGFVVVLDGNLSHQVTDWMALSLHLQAGFGSLAPDGVALVRLVPGFEVGGRGPGWTVTFGVGFGLIGYAQLGGQFDAGGYTAELALLVHSPPGHGAAWFGGLRLSADGMHVSVDDSAMTFSGGAGDLGVTLVVGLELGVAP